MAIYNISPVFSELITIPAGNNTVFQATALYDNCFAIILANGDANGTGTSNTLPVRMALKSSTQDLTASLTDADAATLNADVSLSFSLGTATQRVGGNILVFQSLGGTSDPINVYISQICQAGE